MRNAIWILALAVGCHYSPGGNAGDDLPPGVDAPTDDAIDDVPIDAQACFGSGAFVVCLTQQPTEAIDLSTLTGDDLDTGESTLCLSPTPTSWTTGGQRDACVIARTNITLPVGTTANFNGGRELVLVATGTLTISGTLDLSASSTGGGDKGPDSSPGQDNCDAGNGSSSGNKGGGGGGGGLGDLGNIGGTANGSGGTSGSAGSSEVAPHDVLRGGCRGGTGSNGGNANIASFGEGGGAAFLVGATVVIDGTINASGAGAQGGRKDKGGGGGGGAGGMLVIDGTTVTITGTLVANGGGGGGGADASNDGGNGGEANPAMPTMQALAGAKGGPGSGAGGKGGAAAVPAEAGGNFGDGGAGGGGGSIGVIRMLHGTIPAANISPTATN